MAIGYTPTTWVDNDTLVDAARLNNIETGVQAACDELDEFYDSSTKEMNAPGSVNIQELNSNINIGSSSVWIGLAAYISFLRLHSQNSAEYTVGDINDALSNALSLINYGGDIIIQNAENSSFVHGDIKLLTDGQALYNGVEIATKAKVGASSTDLNTLTSEGMYQIQNPNNAPVGVTGWVTLSVVPTSNDETYCRQMLYIPSSDDIYTRNNAGGTWGSWNKIATKSDLVNGYVPFDATRSAVDLNNLTSCGFHSTYNANNRPSDVTGFATVLVIPINNDTAYARQMLFPVKANAVYSRYCDGGNWSSWTRLH